VHRNFQLPSIHVFNHAGDLHENSSRPPVDFHFVFISHAGDKVETQRSVVNNFYRAIYHFSPFSLHFHHSRERASIILMSFPCTHSTQLSLSRRLALLDVKSSVKENAENEIIKILSLSLSYEK
jgi:hypothetical protein